MTIEQSHIHQKLTAHTEKRAAGGCNGNADGYPTDCYLLGGALYNNGKVWKAPQPSFLPTPGTGYKGNWHFVEAYFQLNSIANGTGVPDGIVRYWFDGQLVIEHANVLLRTGTHPNMKFNRSEEHTSELQSLAYLVCRLLLEKKKKTHKYTCRRENQTAYGSDVAESVVRWEIT